MKYEIIEINGRKFKLDTKETVDNPVIIYKGVNDVYGRCSAAKQSIWESWACWFRECNSHMFGVTSHNSNFFTICGCVTWLDSDKKPVEYYLKITHANNYAWRVKRDV